MNILLLAKALFVVTRLEKSTNNEQLRLLGNQMNGFNDFHEMINCLNEKNLSELCEKFLTDHESAMEILSQYCRDSGLIYDRTEIKDHMTTMHNNGEFDNVVCFGIELSENQLYKRFHPD